MAIRPNDLSWAVNLRKNDIVANKSDHLNENLP